MPVLNLNFIEGQLALDDSHPSLPSGSSDAPEHQHACVTDSLERALHDLPPNAPIVICIHGFKFSPLVAGRSPHEHILSLEPRSECWKAVSWPRRLGFSGHAPEEGLCIAFGWGARGSIWQAYAQAQKAGDALADLINTLPRSPSQPVHLVGHSLGARVALRALSACSKGQIQRVILLAAAEFRSVATTALQSPAGKTAEVFNITSRENDVFDALLELCLAPRWGDWALGAGLEAELQSADVQTRNWLDIQIDDAKCLERLGDLGYQVAPPSRRICHWSAYVRPGLFDLYSALLRAPQQTPLALLHRHLPRKTAPRWSRLFAAPNRFMSLPFFRKQTF